MAQEFKSGEIVPQSGIYRITHDPSHMEAHEVTAIKGRRFPTCRHCKASNRSSFLRKRESTVAAAAYVRPEVDYQITYHMLSSRRRTT
jgi:hypothetical protein